MLKMYCQSCGALHTYGADKPNFCIKCGTKFAHAKAEAPIKGKSVKVEGETAYVPTDIQELDVEIELDQHRNTVTMSQLLSASDPNVLPSKLDDRPGPPPERIY